MSPKIKQEQHLSGKQKACSTTGDQVFRGCFYLFFYGRIMNSEQFINYWNYQFQLVKTLRFKVQLTKYCTYNTGEILINW